MSKNANSPSGSNNNILEIAKLAKELSALDGDVERKGAEQTSGAPEPNSGRQNPGEDPNNKALLDRAKKLSEAGSRWSESYPEGAAALIDILQNGRPPKCLYGTDSLDNLHTFLTGAVKQAITIGGAKTEEGAGAIYLHNPLHDELVMAASSGFPFDTITRTGWLNDFKKAHSDKAVEFEENRDRLMYLRGLRQKLAGTNIARHDWIRYTLRGIYPQRRKSGVNCNKDLIGIAYYKPGTGITGQLFDKEGGPKLERTRLNEQNIKKNSPSDPEPTDKRTFVEAIEGALKHILDEEDSLLYKHLREELLQKRTIVYEKREDMGAGRQVKAGQYEPLQFPSPDFIGPFLGTVLRFNGEHLGILKIEKHIFKMPKKTRNSKASDWKMKDKPEFRSEDTAHFLLFSYTLSGYLYILKHHAGIDLSEGWTRSV